MVGPQVTLMVDGIQGKHQNQETGRLAISSKFTSKFRMKKNVQKTNKSQFFQQSILKEPQDNTFILTNLNLNGEIRIPCILTLLLREMVKKVKLLSGTHLMEVRKVMLMGDGIQDNLQRLKTGQSETSSSYKQRLLKKALQKAIQ